MRSTTARCSTEHVTKSSAYTKVCCLKYAMLIVILVSLFSIPQSLHADKTAITRLTNDGKSWTRLGLGWSPDGKHISFSKQYDDGYQTWIMDADGSNAKAVSRIGWQDSWSWSPDSKKIVYVYVEKRKWTNEASVYVYDVTTGETKNIASGFPFSVLQQYSGWGSWEWTNDSKAVVTLMTRSSDSSSMGESFLFDVDTGRRIGLTPNNYHTGLLYAGSWSPDNAHFALASKSSSDAHERIWVCKRDGSGLTAITPSDWDVNSDPRWCPTGDTIAFATSNGRLEDEKKAQLSDIWIIKPDGTDAHPITHGSSSSTAKRISYSSPEWTPDGRYISCMTQKFGESGLESLIGMCLIDAKSGEVITVIDNDPNSDKVVQGFDNKQLNRPTTSSRLAFTAQEFTVMGRKTGSPVYQNQTDLLYSYDIPTRKLNEIERYFTREDGIALYPGENWPPLWSPDGENLLFVKAKVLSYTDGTYQPDLYVYHADTTTSQRLALPPESSSSTISSSSIATSPTFVAGAAVLIQPKYRRAAEIAQSLPSADGLICKADANLNALVVFAPDEASFDRLKKDVSLLDQLPSEIMVDVLVTELTRDASRQLGLDWQYTHGHVSTSFPLTNGTDAGQLIFQGVGTLGHQFLTTLSFLEGQGKAKVRANPRVLANCGTQSTINIRRTHNFFYDSGTDYQGKPVRTRSDISADTILKICPMLLSSSRISMNLDATVDSFVFTGDSDLPDTTRRQAVTDVTCGDGETVVIGGLTLEEETILHQNTPVLSSLPLVGGLFKKVSRTKKDSDLVIFVTPHVYGRAN